MKTCSPRPSTRKLHGARVLVADLTGELHRVLAEPLRHRRVELRRGRDLHDLLVAALHRAVPLPQVDDVPGAVREDLHLDVAGIVHRLLQEHRRVAERALGLAARRVHGGLQLLAAVHAAQPAPAAAGRGLHEQREPDPVGRLQLPSGLGRGRAQHRQARAARRLDGLDLVAREPQHGRRRADELDPVAFARLRQLGALREESVAGVDGVGPDAQRGLDDAVHVEVGPDGVTAAADLVRLVRLLPVQGEPVLVRVHGDAGDAQFVGGAERAYGDLPAVGDEQLVDHLSLPGDGSGASARARRPPGLDAELRR